jgi:hypothetical protein
LHYYCCLKIPNFKPQNCGGLSIDWCTFTNR